MERIRTDHPALCRRVGHDWTNWGLWSAASRPFVPMVSPADVVPTLEPLLAYRDRLCGRCGAREVQDYQGKIVQQEE